MNALWMALLFVLLGADLLGIGILGKYAVDTEACIVCCILAAISLLCHAVVRKREERQGRKI